MFESIENIFPIPPTGGRSCDTMLQTNSSVSLFVSAVPFTAVNDCIVKGIMCGGVPALISPTGHAIVGATFVKNPLSTAFPLSPVSVSVNKKLKIYDSNNPAFEP